MTFQLTYSGTHRRAPSPARAREGVATVAPAPSGGGAVPARFGELGSALLNPERARAAEADGARASAVRTVRHGRVGQAQGSYGLATSFTRGREYRTRRRRKALEVRSGGAVEAGNRRDGRRKEGQEGKGAR